VKSENVADKTELKKRIEDITAQKGESDGRVTGGITVDESIFGGKCPCGGRIIIRTGLGLTQEICASCGRPYIPETFGS